MTETETMTEIGIGTETEIGTGIGPLIKLHEALRDGEGALLHLLYPTKGAVGALRNGRNMAVFVEKLLQVRIVFLCVNILLQGALVQFILLKV